MNSVYKTFNKLIENILVSSRGWIESVTVVSPDGMPVAYNESSPVNHDFVAAATAAIGGAVSSVVELLNANGFNKIDVQLNDKRYLLIRKFQNYYIVCTTKPNPNLGFISLVLETYISQAKT